MRSSYRFLCAISAFLMAAVSAHAQSQGLNQGQPIGEITPDVHDGALLIADQVDGKPLGNNGLFQLVATGDKRPARWVRNLVGIRVETAQ